MKFDYEARKIYFKPSKNYSGMTTSDLIKEWLSSPANETQRYFIYKELNARPGGFSRPAEIADLKERDKKRYNAKQDREQKRFRLKEGETLIYCIDELLYNPLVRMIFVLISILPPVIILLKGYENHNYSMLLETIAFALFCGSLRITRAFTGKIFITDSRLGFCTSIFWGINFSFSFIDAARLTLLIDIERIIFNFNKIRGPFWNNEFLLALEQKDNNIHKKFYIEALSTDFFLKCLAEIVRAIDGHISITDNVWNATIKYSGKA